MLGVMTSSGCGTCAPSPLASHQWHLADKELDAQFSSSVLGNLSLFSYWETPSQGVNPKPKVLWCRQILTPPWLLICPRRAVTARRVWEFRYPALQSGLVTCYCESAG